MSAEHIPREWVRTDRHPQLPGRNLGCVSIEGGGTLLYDPDNPEAYIQGEAYPLGNDAAVTAGRSA